MAQKKCLLNDNAFDELTKESAYWIGFLMADGNISIRKHGAPELSVVLANKDRQHVEKFRRFLGSTHALIDISSTKATRFSVRSEKLVSALAKYGVVPNKSFITDAPVILEMNSDFWRGIIDGDGWIAIDNRNRPRLELVGSEKMLHQFIAFVQACHPQCGASVRPHKGIFKVGLLCTAATEVIRSLYDNESVALDRKQAVASTILECRQESGIISTV